MKMKVDKFHIALAVLSGVLVAILLQQIGRTNAALADAERYKRFSVWSLDHADAQFAGYLKQSATTQRELEKYLTDDAREKMRASGMLSVVPPLPEGEKIAKPFEGNVDVHTFEEIQALRRRAK